MPHSACAMGESKGAQSTLDRRWMGRKAKGARWHTWKTLKNLPFQSLLSMLVFAVLSLCRISSIPYCLDLLPEFFKRQLWGHFFQEAHLNSLNSCHYHPICPRGDWICPISVSLTSWLSLYQNSHHLLCWSSFFLLLFTPHPIQMWTP